VLTEGANDLLALSLSECQFYKKTFRCQVSPIRSIYATNCKYGTYRNNRCVEFLSLSRALILFGWLGVDLHGFLGLIRIEQKDAVENSVLVGERPAYS
jgi:hypothetical protein